MTDTENQLTSSQSRGDISPFEKNNTQEIIMLDLKSLDPKTLCYRIDSGYFLSEELSDTISFASAFEEYTSSLDGAIVSEEHIENINKIKSFLNFLSWQIATYHKIISVSQKAFAINVDNVVSARLSDILETERLLEDLAIELFAKNKSSYNLPTYLNEFNNAVDHYRSFKSIIKDRRDKLIFYMKKRINEINERLKNGEYTRLHKQINKVQDKLKSLYPEQRKLIENEIDQLNKNIQEYRNWHISVVYPKQESLCEQMEQMLEDTQMQAFEKIEQMKMLQSQWKELSQGLDEQKYWTRFNNASKKVFESCHSFFEERKKDKEENSIKRIEIVSYLQKFVDEIDWENVNWQQLSHTYRDVRKKWRSLGSYAKDHGGENKEKFNTLIKKLEEQLSSFYAKNTEHKKELIDKVKSLVVDNDISLKRAIETCKEVQQQWKQVPFSGDNDSALWKEFRSSCDIFFQKRKEIKEKREKDPSYKTFKEGNKICFELDKLFKDENLSVEDKKSKGDILKSNFNNLDLSQLLPESQEKLKERVEFLYSKLYRNPRTNSHHKHTKKIISNENNINNSKKIGVIKGILDTLEKFFELEVAGKSEELQALLESSKNIPDSLSSKLNKHLSSRLYELSIDDVRNACVSLEVMQGIDSLEEDKNLRRELQISLLSNKFNKNSSAEESWKYARDTIELIAESLVTEKSLSLVKRIIEHSRLIVKHNHKLRW